MKKALTAMTLATAGLLSINGFAAKVNTKEIVDIRHAFIATSNLTDKQKAAIIIEGAEKMMTPVGWIYAGDLVNAALLDDPDNKKAQFYRRLLAPALKLQGYYRRVTPFVQRFGSKIDKANHAKNVAEIPSIGGAFDALMGGEGEEIRTEAEIQVVLDEVMQEVDKFRLFLKENKSLKLNVVFTSEKEEITEDVTYGRIAKDCNVIQREQGLYEVTTNCEHLNTKRYKIDRSDIESLQLMSAAFEVYLAMTNAYRMDGVAKIKRQNDRREEKGMKDLTDREVVSILKGEQSFGSLRRANKLALVPSLTSDLLAGTRWFKKYQDQFCKVVQNDWGKEEKPVERPDHFVESGFCVYATNDSLYETVSKKVDYILAGGIVTETVTRTKGGYDFIKEANGGERWVWKETVVDQGNFRINYMKPFTQPELNLKNILPDVFDRCGQVKEAKDKSIIAGLSVDNEGDRILRIKEVIPSPLDNKNCN